MEAEGQATETGVSEAQAPNLLQRVVMAFVSPGKLGEVLRARSPWFWTLAIPAVIGLIAMLVVPQDIWIEMMEARARDTQGGPDAETVARFAQIGGAVFTLVVTFVTAAVGAGVLYLVFNVGLGQDLTYRQQLSAISHVFWISALGTLLTVPVWISQANMQVALGLGLLLPDEPATFVEKFLNGITIFGLWGTLALGAIESGLSGGRTSPGKAIGLLLVLYLVWAMIKGIIPS